MYEVVVWPTIRNIYLPVSISFTYASNLKLLQPVQNIHDIFTVNKSYKTHAETRNLKRLVCQFHQLKCNPHDYHVVCIDSNKLLAIVPLNPLSAKEIPSLKVRKMTPILTFSSLVSPRARCIISLWLCPDPIMIPLYKSCSVRKSHLYCICFNLL